MSSSPTIKESSNGAPFSSSDRAVPSAPTYGTFESNEATVIGISAITVSNRTSRRWKVSTIFISLLCVPGIFCFLMWACGALEMIWYMMLCGPLFPSGGQLGSALFFPRGAPRTWSNYKNQSFAVGFDLTAGYGTAAVAFNNGTIINLGRAEGSYDYNEVLARLSLKSSSHPTPPYYGCDAKNKDLRRQWRRAFNRRLGRPSSLEVAALASLIIPLKIQTKAFLAAYRLGPLEMAFITAPHLPALYAEDLVDAAEYAGIQMLTLPGAVFSYPAKDGAWVVSEINTAFAGNGLGLQGFSEPYFDSLNAISDSDAFSPSPRRNDRRDGDDNKKETPPRRESNNVLSVLYTAEALAAHLIPYMDSAPHFTYAYGTANFSLGLPPSILDSLDTNASYWQQIRLSLRSTLNSNYVHGHELRRVIIHGEFAHHEIFNGVLREEVKRAQEEKRWDGRDGVEKTKWYSEDPVFAASRGAALFARWCPRLKSSYSCFPDLRPRMKDWF